MNAKMHQYVYLDTDVILRLKWGVEVRQHVHVKRVVHHHFGGDFDEVRSDGLGNEREGAGSPQVRFNYLQDASGRERNLRQADTAGIIFLLCGHLDYESAVTAQIDQFKAVLKAHVH